MAPDTGGIDPYALIRRSDRDPLCLRTLLQAGADDRICLVGHCIVSHTAAKIHDSPVLKGKDCKIAAQASLFTVAQGELRVRRKQEYRLLIVADVILHILHAALLITPCHHAQAVGKGGAQILKKLSHIISKDQRAFVIHNSAPHQIAILYHHIIGIRVPSVAGRHHIQMGDGADILLLLPHKLRIPQIVPAVHGLKSHALPDLQRLAQGTPHLHSKRRPFLCLRLYAGDIHHGLYIPDDILHICLNKFICL